MKLAKHFPFANTLFAIVGFFAIALYACKDNDEQSNIPLVEVNISILINDPQFINLKNVGGWEYVTGGSRGIVVYRLSTDEFKAYDRHCTFEPTSSCALVSVDATNIQAVDDCCGSVFTLTNGSVTRPPANLPLKEYATSFDGTTLRITN